MSALNKYVELQANLKLLKLIKENECLWKPDAQHYTNNPVKFQAWKEIAKAVNSTEERCCKRWRYIRQTYAQDIKSNSRQSNYYLSPHVDFVRPYIKLPPCSQLNESNSDGSKDEFAQALKKQNDKETPVEAEKFLEKQFQELIEGIGEKNTKIKTNDVINVQVGAKSTLSCSNSKRKMDIHDNELKAKHSKIVPIKSDVNKNWMFMESILPFVDDMSKKQIRRFRRKVMVLIDDVLQNKNIDRPELLK